MAVTGIIFWSSGCTISTRCHHLNRVSNIKWPVKWPLVCSSLNAGELCPPLRCQQCNKHPMWGSAFSIQFTMLARAHLWPVISFSCLWTIWNLCHLYLLISISFTDDWCSIVYWQEYGVEFMLYLRFFPTLILYAYSSRHSLLDLWHTSIIKKGC